MNKQELIEKINNLQYLLSWNIPRINKETVLELIEQLDEPEKVKVPRFVANWISYAKGWNKTLHYALENSPGEVNLWFCENETNRQNTFARAWLDGYTVEKEKRYTVVMEATKQPLYYNAVDKKLFFSMGGLATKFTRKELEDADFGWVFDCQGIEIEEVEE